MKHTIGQGYSAVRGLNAVCSWPHAKRLLREYQKQLVYWSQNKIPLVKDPIAVFSAEWLATRFDMKIVVLIRHPAAFVSSVKRLGWTMDFSHLLQQPLLMQDHLCLFRHEIEHYANGGHDIVGWASLLWRVIYCVIAKYRDSHPDWIFLRHEDISRDPLGRFEDLFRRLDLDFQEPSIRQAIYETTNSSNPIEVSGSTRSIKRNSRASIWNWKHRLSEWEIEQVRKQTEDVSRLFYSDVDW